MLFVCSESHIVVNNAKRVVLLDEILDAFVEPVGKIWEEERAIASGGRNAIRGAILVKKYGTPKVDQLYRMLDNGRVFRIWLSANPIYNGDELEGWMYMGVEN